MAEDLELIRAILHPTDYPKAVLEAIPQTVVGEDSVQPWRIENTRILAIVAHKDARRVSEEGSLFICTSPTDTGQDVEIESVYPLTLDFSISVGQVKSMTSELSGASTKEVGFSLVINPGKKMESELDMEEKDMTFLTRDVKSLRHFLTECRGLINSEGAVVFTSVMFTVLSLGIDSVDLSPEFEWLLRYTSDRVMPRWFGHTPEDLRLVNEPLNTRLSPATAGLSGDDMADFRLIRDDWVLAQARQMSNNAQHTLRVRLGTFNVNGQLPSQDLSSWITSSPSTSGLTDSTKGPGAASSRSSISSSITKGDVNNLADLHSDLLVLGFQELDLSTEALVYSTGTAREDAWCQAIFAALGDKRDEYEKLVSKQLVGMLIIILVKKSLRSCFSNVSTSVAGAGIMGGNKGGVAIHLAFTPPVPGTSEVTSPGPTILTFVNSHLAAFDEMYEKRNLDFQDLSKRLKFVSQLADETASTSVRVTAYESDVLFWMADLNYRIEIPDEDVRRILACETWQGRFEMLLQHDQVEFNDVQPLVLLNRWTQLKKASRTGRAFTGFIEHPISYPPTYRFGSTLEKDELGYDIKRKPAYTDRILHMGGRNVAIQQLSYTRHPQIMMSDHRPVAANFLLDVNVYDSIVYKETCQKLYKSVARMHEFSRRLLKLDKTSVDLGSISYKNVTSRTINITNLGKGPCAYRFLPPGLDSNVHPEWLHIEPMQAIILPGESVQLTLSPNVNSVMAKLNLGKKDLEATLILHTLMGKDHFITVTAEYRASSPL
ncbi:hypothetical protein H0H92_014968 [Tricholoma furcatifolium]|nr:hypothetical protein H0H92_014968 [Tricholoma furcatifolium]